MEHRQKRFAVLIDADNVPPSLIEGLLEEVANQGVASIRRIYGDWSSDSLRGWKEFLLDTAIEPVQQHPYTRGKNATDMKMLIDAMDILYDGNMDGFCLVTSDSDFTPLAHRIRQSGLTVFGFGESKTPRAFVRACDRFVYLDVLRKSGDAEDEAEETTTAASRKSAPLKSDSRLVTMMRHALEDAADDSGWATLSLLGQTIANANPDFDPRLYGHKKLGDLVKAIGLFEIDEQPVGGGPARQILVRGRKKKS